MAGGARTSERELWRGRPSRHRLFRPADAALIPASVLAAAFAFWWEAQAVTDPSWPALFAIGGVPVVLGGLYLLVGRFVVRALVSRRTRYLLTDRRLTIVGGLSGIRETSTYLTALAPPVITERPDGSGDLGFGAFPTVADAFRHEGNTWRLWATEPGPTPVLWDIPDVRRVRDVIADAQAAQPPTR